MKDYRRVFQSLTLFFKSDIDIVFQICCQTVENLHYSPLFVLGMFPQQLLNGKPLAMTSASGASIQQQQFMAYQFAGKHYCPPWTICLAHLTQALMFLISRMWVWVLVLTLSLKQDSKHYYCFPFDGACSPWPNFVGLFTGKQIMLIIA